MRTGDCCETALPGAVVGVRDFSFPISSQSAPRSLSLRIRNRSEREGFLFAFGGGDAGNVPLWNIGGEIVGVLEGED